jgi:hypothetical protein
MKIYKLALLCFIRGVVHVSAHGVQVAHCETPNGNLRVFVEHWHGAGQTANAGDTITIQVTAGNETTVANVIASGVIPNSDLASLPGCAIDTLRVDSECGGQANGDNNWAYWDFTPNSCGIPTTVKLLQGDTVVFAEGCGNLYPTELSVSDDFGCVIPTQEPSKSPTHSPTKAPTNSPTKAPTKVPSSAPSDVPSKAPTDSPTKAPSKAPSSAPTTPMCRAEQLTVYTVEASSVENSYVASNVVDGKRNSRWASLGPNEYRKLTEADGVLDEQWLKLDMGGVRFIDSVNLEWERAYSRNWNIEVSTDGETWEVVHSDKNGQSGTVHVSMLNVVAQYVRIYSYEGDRNYGISVFEVKIFGDLSADCSSSPSTIPNCADPAVIGLDDAIASASSEEGSHFSPDKAIDGDGKSRWSSAFTDDEWFALDLGHPTRIDAVWITWENAYPRKYMLQVAESLSGTWTTIVEEDNSDGETDILDGQQTVTQYVQILCIERARDCYGNSMWDFEVRGTQDQACLMP